MPIEIRELVIRTVVVDGGSPPAPQHGGGVLREGEGAPLDTDALVQECVRQVLQVLARERDR